MSAPYVQLETPLSDDSVVCRCCLVDCGEMKDMLEWGMIEEYSKYSGVQIHSSEDISKLICSSCEAALMQCKSFQEQCQQADNTLRNLMIKKETAFKKNTIKYAFHENKLIFTIVAPDFTKTINLPCPYNCKSTFMRKTDVLSHLIKSHDHKKNYVIENHYHCWETDCSYQKDSKQKRYFHERKTVNQHYNRVHKSKIFHCGKCETAYSTAPDFNRHLNTCSMVFLCQECNKQYNTKDRLVVHLLRKHPDKHKEYKRARKAEKREKVMPYDCIVIKKNKQGTAPSMLETDSPKRSFATQTLDPKTSIKNDVRLPSWQNNNSEISTQTGLEDVLSIRSNSEDDSLFYSETTLSDIQTQTFPLEFGLFVNRSHKETLTEAIDISIKGTQTCLCYCDSPKLNFGGLDAVPSPRSGNLTSTETQTAELVARSASDVILNFNSTETQTCFDEVFKDSL